MTEVLVPRFMAQEPLIASFFADTARDTFHIAPSTPLVTVARTTNVHCDVIAEPPSPPLPDKACPPRSRKRKVCELKPDVGPSEESISDEERNLRIAEAEVLFPKYMADRNSKRVKVNADSTRNKLPLLTFLSSSEYTTKWEDYYQCSPSLGTKSRSKVLRFFESDCRVPGSAAARNATAERELNPLYYDQEWNQRVNIFCPGFIDPPGMGSLDTNPILRGRGIRSAQNRVKMDSFILALQREMGTEYVDINTARYFPRSDGRVYTFPDEKGRRLLRMKNGELDMDVCIRNREIDRAMDLVRFVYQNQGLEWTEEEEEAWDREIVRYVNPRTVCHGRTFFSENCAVDDDRYSPPELLNERAYAPPTETCAEELGTMFYWSERAGRMVSVEELRVEKEENLKIDAKYEAATTVEETCGRHSNSRSPSRRSRNSSE